MNKPRHYEYYTKLKTQPILQDKVDYVSEAFLKRCIEYDKWLQKREDENNKR